MLNEVAPPGWGHTKAEKEKTKPNKPKSKIGGSAAAFKRALDDGRFKGLPGDKTKKEKTASMFKLMWSMKKKGDKPHYKPGTDEKKKKYQGVNESVQNNKVDLILKTGVNNVLKQDNKDYDRGLLAKVNKDGSYDVAYWYDEYKAYPVEVVIDGKSIKKDAKNIHIKYHPELKKKNKEEAKDAMKEETTYKTRDKELKRTSGARNERYKTLHKKTGEGNVDVNEKNEYEKLKKKIGSKKMHKEPVVVDETVDYEGRAKESEKFHSFYKKAKAAKARKQADSTRSDSRIRGVKFSDAKGSGRMRGGKKVYD